jgi:transcriptional regulator with XRE-family HTH domain
MDAKKFGNKLKELREKKHTQSELGGILKVGLKQIQRYENGELLPDHEKVQKLVDIYKYDFISLIYDVPRGVGPEIDIVPHYKQEGGGNLDDFRAILKTLSDSHKELTAAHKEISESNNKLADNEKVILSLFPTVNDNKQTIQEIAATLLGLRGYTEELASRLTKAPKREISQAVNKMVMEAKKVVENKGTLSGEGR